MIETSYICDSSASGKSNHHIEQITPHTHTNTHTHLEHIWNLALPDAREYMESGTTTA